MKRGKQGETKIESRKAKYDNFFFLFFFVFFWGGCAKLCDGAGGSAPRPLLPPGPGPGPGTKLYNNFSFAETKGGLRVA